ncbi:MAG TPA: 6-carboxytetrahydropterin synthase QueD [Deltaproteobacteria bacterium]|nr:6-carboxytetrahydropterin synthase QueD [Deltaproteobacteria bacterium]
MYYVHTMFKARVTATFSAAHSLRGYRGDCERLHGHNYRVEVTVESGGLDDTGLVMDFRELKDMLGAVLDRLDHRCLNELPYFSEVNPSAEHIAAYVFDSLENAVRPPARLAEVTVWENDTCSVTRCRP